MPVIRTPPNSRAGEKFDVIGKGKPGSGVSHVGLLASKQNCAAGGIVAVLDVAPPIRQGNMRAEIVGWLDHLSYQEIRAMELWNQDTQTRTTISPTQHNDPLEDYVVSPPFDLQKDSRTGRVIKYKFSCAGYVFHCYQTANIKLTVDEQSLPLVDEKALLSVWPTLRHTVQADRIRIGIGGPGPWRILLPGYLVRALSAVTRANLPYQPVPGDHILP